MKRFCTLENCVICKSLIISLTKQLQQQHQCMMYNSIRNYANVIKDANGIVTTWNMNNNNNNNNNTSDIGRLRLSFIVKVQRRKSRMHNKTKAKLNLIQAAAETKNAILRINDKTENTMEKAEARKIKKISILCTGDEGMTICAYLLSSRIAKEIVIVRARTDWINAMALDILVDTLELDDCLITICTTGERTENSDYVIVAANAEPKGKSYMDMAQQTANLLKGFVPQVAEINPSAIFLVASHPNELMTWVTQRIGNISHERCFSTGCHLDTARFKYYIAKRLNEEPSAIEGYVIGEHGEHSVPVWSSVTINGVPLLSIQPDAGLPNDPNRWYQIHELVVQAALEDFIATHNNLVTNWSLALTVADIIETISAKGVMSVGTDINGFSSIDEHVVLSLPCRITREGITHIAHIPLTNWERDLLLEAAHNQLNKQNLLKID